jgi:signal transduction histidine kinase
MLDAAAFSGGVTRSELTSEMLALDPGAHLCLIYDKDPSEQMPGLLPYFRQGLEQGERCIYVADDQTIEELSGAFAGYGIDVPSATNRGALRLWGRDQWRPPDELDSASKAAQLRYLIAEALDAGFKGLRLAVEMTWTLGPDIGMERLEHWEATINDVFASKVPARIVCQYSRARLTPQAVESAFATHPLMVLGSEVCPNPFYRAALILGSNGQTQVEAGSERVDWMLAQLRWARAFERERSRRIRAEEVAHRAETERQRLEEMYSIAKATAEDLRKAQQMKDDFLGMISHELRTPLTTIYGNAHILARNGSLGLTEDDRATAIADIETESQRLQQIIENLLVLARFDKEQGMELERVDVGEQVAEVVKAFNRRRPTRTVNLEIAPNLPAIEAKPIYFELVLKNLLSNADKYSPSATPIDLRVEASAGRVLFSVLDRGRGVAAEDVERVFQPFERGTGATYVEGLGIGLAVCRRIVEALGGRIWAAPRPDGGTEFSFTLLRSR